MDRNFSELLQAQWDKGRFVCVGLDSEYKKIPDSVKRHGIETAVTQFNFAIVEKTSDVAGFYKPNLAFYLAEGLAGLESLRNTIDFIHSSASHVPVILDAKFADIGNTNNGYAGFAFDYLKADAVTVHPYLGSEAMQPFLAEKDKGIIVLCRTSNLGAGEFQDLPVLEQDPEVDGGFLSPPFYQVLAEQVATNWNRNGNCGLVVGATYPEELAKVRQIVGDMPILIPGIGAQGGDLEKTVQAGRNSRGQGMIINSSRGIIFAGKGPDFPQDARRETQKLHDAITECLSTPTAV